MYFPEVILPGLGQRSSNLHFIFLSIISLAFEYFPRNAGDVSGARSLGREWRKKGRYEGVLEVCPQSEYPFICLSNRETPSLLHHALLKHVIILTENLPGRPAMQLSRRAPA